MAKTDMMADSLNEETKLRARADSKLHRGMIREILNIMKVDSARISSIHSHAKTISQSIGDDTTTLAISFLMSNPYHETIRSDISADITKVRESKHDD